ncbi:MAG: hypothetical protein HYY61_06915 [Deltaproteobacteria bacterium]|nr:hypothetical protein [Deltaproteobacteria bacterium]
MKQQWKIYFLMILVSLSLGCFEKASQSPSPSSLLREDQESPVISLIPAQPLTFIQSVADWEDSSSFLPSFEVRAEDSDTAAKYVRLFYYIYAEGQRLQDSSFEEVKLESYQGTIHVTKKNIAPASTAFVGTKNFILRLKATDGTNSPVLKEVPFSISNTQIAVAVEVDSSEIDLALLGSSDFEVALSEFPQRKPFPFVYSTLLLRPKSSVPIVIQVDFEGYLDNEVQRGQQQWQEDVLERTTVGDVERWSKAPVILEVKELKENGELIDAKIKKLPNEKVGYLLPNDKGGLVLVFKTEAMFREFPLDMRAVSSDLRVDQVKLQGKLKILSSPDNMGSLFYSDSQNWADITPADPFPLLKVVSK